jgi:hypothetical protein
MNPSRKLGTIKKLKKLMSPKKKVVLSGNLLRKQRNQKLIKNQIKKK